MTTTLYTPDEVADLLELHPKTVRRLIREGKIRAHKVGGRWRIGPREVASLTGTDIDDGDEGTTIATTTEVPELETGTFAGPLTVTSLVDIPVASADEAGRIAATIFAAIKGRYPAKDKARVDHLYLAAEGKARFVLWGSPSFTAELLLCIAAITDVGEDDEP